MANNFDLPPELYLEYVTKNLHLKDFLKLRNLNKQYIENVKKNSIEKDLIKLLLRDHGFLGKIDKIMLSLRTKYNGWYSIIPDEKSLENELNAEFEKKLGKYLIQYLGSLYLKNYIFSKFSVIVGKESINNERIIMKNLEKIIFSDHSLHLLSSLSFVPECLAKFSFIASLDILHNLHIL